MNLNKLNKLKIVKRKNNLGKIDVQLYNDAYNQYIHLLETIDEKQANFLYNNLSKLIEDTKNFGKNELGRL